MNNRSSQPNTPKGSLDPREALSELYDQYADAMFRHCLFRLSDHEAAADVTQDIFFKYWRYLEKGEEVQNPRALLYRIANTLIIDTYRKRGRQVSLDMLFEEGFDTDDSNDKSANEEFDSKRLSDMIYFLDETYREVMTLRFVDGFPPQEIADILGISENVVSVRLHRGTKKLKELIEKVYGEII